MDLEITSFKNKPECLKRVWGRKMRKLLFLRSLKWKTSATKQEISQLEQELEF